MAYFIADTHFGHKNILSFDNRPFPDIDTHDKTLIKNWNAAVGYEDDVYILGDLSWHNVTKTIDILETLNGRKHLIIGNHDKRLLKNQNFRSMFVEIAHYKELEIAKNQYVILSHYPIPCFNGHYYGQYHLYGHVHISFESQMMERIKYEMETLYEKPCNMYNVGIMTSLMNYTPRTIEEIIERSKTNGMLE